MGTDVAPAQVDVAGELSRRKVDLFQHLADASRLVDDLIQDGTLWQANSAGWRQSAERVKAATNWAKFCRDTLLGSKFEKAPDLSTLPGDVLASIIREAHEKGSITLTEKTQTLHVDTGKGYFGSPPIDVGGDE